MESLRIWGRRITDKDERRNYLAAEGPKLVALVLFACVNIALFIEAVHRYTVILAAANKSSTWILIARGFGQLLNFNCALICVPVMRTFLSWIRTWRFSVHLPLDKNIVFHRYIAYWIAVCAVAHGMAHYFNYVCCYDSIYGAVSPIAAAWQNKFGITGNIIALASLILYSAAEKRYRISKNFTVFWSTHHLFLVFFVLLLVHGRNFWKWFIGPGALYLLERLLRVIRGNSLTAVRSVHQLNAQVIVIELDKKGFNYLAGQYCFINCPFLSTHEWHPFTISSAPHEPHVTFHIRCVGDWTNSLADFLNPGKRSTLRIDKPISPDGKTHLIRVDGPFGTPAEHVFDYEYVMLVAAGIGVTPYASILKHIAHKKGDKIKKVFFFWTNRDSGSFEWFSDLLNELETSNPAFFEIHTYMTGELKVDDIRTIVFSSEEYVAKQKTIDVVQEPGHNVTVVARAIENYHARSSDEINLQEDDTIIIDSRDASGWWSGKNKRTGAKGLFPSEYVMLIDKVTQLKNNPNRHFGRPFWKDIFNSVKKDVNEKFPGSPKYNVGVFFCGPQILSKELYKFCVSSSKEGNVKFTYHKENF